MTPKNVAVAVLVEPEIRMKLKRKLAEDFDATVDQTALLRFLLDLYLTDIIDPTFEEMQPYLVKRGPQRETA